MYLKMPHWSSENPLPERLSQLQFYQKCWKAQYHYRLKELIMHTWVNNFLWWSYQKTIRMAHACHRILAVQGEFVDPQIDCTELCKGKMWDTTKCPTPKVSAIGEQVASERATCMSYAETSPLKKISRSESLSENSTIRPCSSGTRCLLWFQKRLDILIDILSQRLNWVPFWLLCYVTICGSCLCPLMVMDPHPEVMEGRVASLMLTVDSMVQQFWTALLDGHVWPTVGYSGVMVREVASMVPIAAGTPEQFSSWPLKPTPFQFWC